MRDTGNRSTAYRIRFLMLRFVSEYITRPLSGWKSTLARIAAGIGFTTHLRRAGMRREFIQELRGDSRREAIDIYNHIDLKGLKEAYLACIPQLGI
jgi:hypothetical protein